MTPDQDTIMREMTVDPDASPWTFHLPSGDVELLIRPLTWTDQSDAFGKSFVVTVQTEGNVQKPVMEYDPTRFRIEILKKRIVKAPFPVSEQFLRQLRPEIGNQFNELVPDPFQKMLEAQDAPKD